MSELPLDIPVIDVHVHAYPPEVGRRTQAAMGNPNPTYDGTPEELLSILAEVSTSKVSGAILKNMTPTAEMAKAAWDRVDRPLSQREAREMYDHVKEMIAGRIRRRNVWGNEVNKQYPTLANFIGVDPNFMTPEENVEELEVRVKEGARGISLHPCRNLHRPEDRRLWPLYERAQEMDVPILTHSGTEARPGWGYAPAYMGLYTRPIDFKEVLASFPRLRWIFAHMGHGFFDEAIEVAHQYPNVYFDTSTEVEGTNSPPRHSNEALVQLLRRLGIEKLMFGSDWVFGNDAIVKSAERLASLPLTDNEKELIFYRNAQNFLGL